jgi:hypothetical protein
MAVTFRRRISWPKNDLLLPPELFDVNVPPGLGPVEVRVPKYVDVGQMMQLAPGSNSSSSGTLSSTEGLVKPNLTVSFPNPSAQWRRGPAPGASDPNRGPCQFQFTGGEVLLDFTLELYLLDTANFDPKDDLSVQIFTCLYEHELLHVLDAMDIANNWLPLRLNTESTVARYLVQGQPYIYGTPSMVLAQLEKEFQTFITNTIQVAIFNLWATESNRRGHLRDAPAQYQIVQDKVDALRARQINRPHH